jgi:PAS domain S-box-containing protein
MAEQVEALKRELEQERRNRAAVEGLLEAMSRELDAVTRELLRLHQAQEEKHGEQQRMADELRESVARQRESQGKLSAIVNSVMDAVIAIDSQGIIHTYNRAAEKIFGYSVTETIGRNVAMLLPEAVRHELDGYLRRYLETMEATMIGTTREVEGVRKNGSPLPLEISITEMEFKDSRMFVGICRDITQRKRQEREKAALEQELRQAQKMESLGTLAGGIAHEINTPVQYVGDNVRFLREAFADMTEALTAYKALAAAAAADELLPGPRAKAETAAASIDLDYLLCEIPNSIVQSLEGVGRISEIVHAIKAFSHPDAQEKAPVDINQSIATTVMVARNQWKYVADLVEDFDENLPPVPCLPGQFNQVILNLIINAVHAIEDARRSEKGRITISTRKCERSVEIRVADSGTGISEETLGKIFDPFFTTKEPGRGTGQGLAICHSIITKKHGGTITAESKIGEGTTFVIRLPLGEDGQSQEAA